MPAGIQVRGDHGFFQIDGETQMMTLARKGTVGSQVLQFANNDAAYCRFAVPVNPGEVIAIRCAYPVLHTGIRNDAAEYIARGATSATLDYWVFAPHTDSGLRYGLRISNAAGVLLYDTGRAPMRFAANVQGVGTFPVPAGRTLAMVCTASYNRVTRTTTGSGQSNNRVGIATAYGNFAALADGVIQIDGPFPYQLLAQPLTANSAAWADTWDNGTQCAFTLLDVTGN